MPEKTQKLMKVGVVILFAVAVFFSLYKLTESPPFWYDEGWYYQSAANLATTGVYGIQYSPATITPSSFIQTVSYPLIYPLALWFKVFGVSVFAGRFFMAIIILLILAAAYTLAKKLFASGALALGALALLATFPPLYGNGKSILGETPGLLYLLLFLICFYVARSTISKRYLWFIVSGLLAGFCLATKPMFFVLAPGLAVLLVLEWRRKSITPKEVAIWIISCIVPMLIWILIQIGPGDSLSSLIGYYASPYSYDAAAATATAAVPTPGLIATVWHNFIALFKNVNSLYTVGILLAWLVSFFVRARSKIRIAGEEMAAFIFALLVCLAFLRIGTILRYLFAAQIIALVFLPNALSVLARAFVPKAKGLVIAIIVILSLYGTYQLSFDSYVAEAYSSHRTQFWQDYFATKVSTSTSVFFYDTPEVVPFMRGRNYYQLLLSTKANPLGKEWLPALRAGIPDMAIVETVKYEPAKETIFKAYKIEQTVPKYTILERK